MKTIKHNWQGKLRHSKDICDDWGCIRDESGNRIITVSLPYFDDAALNEHRRNKTDPTQDRVDAILAGLNSNPATVEQIGGDLVEENAELKAKLAEYERHDNDLHDALVKYDRLFDEAVLIKQKLAEWKGTLGGYGNEPENVLHWIQGATTRCILSEEYERQIKEGELIPHDIAAAYTLWLCEEQTANSPNYGSLKDYAARRQKEGGE